MAGAMNLDQAQARAITALGTGQAAIYAEGADRPYLVKIGQAKGAGSRTTARPTDAQLRLALVSGNAFDEAIYQPRLGCERCGLWKSNPARCATIRDTALTAQANTGFVEAYRRYSLSLAEEPARAVDGYPDLLQQVKQLGRPGDGQELRDMTLCAVIHRSAEEVEQQGQRYDMPYDALADMHGALLALLTPIVKNFQNDQAALATLHQHVETKARGYGQLMRKLTEQPTGPFAGCIFCESRCRYGFDLAPLAADTTLQRDVVDAIERIQDDALMWARLAAISRAAAARAITLSDPRQSHAAALCFACQAGAALKFSGDSQRKLAKNTRDTLAKTQGT